MKKIFYLIIIITLPLIAFFQYKDYMRFRPEAGYDFELKQNVDVNYYDQNLVQEYFRNAVEIGAVARRSWYNSEIDVRFPGESIEAQNAAALYNQLISRNRYIEAKLLESAKYKSDGYTDAQVRDMEMGIDPGKRRLMDQKQNYIGITTGINGVYAWTVQKKLADKGYELPLDGVFLVESDNALKAFQGDNGLFPSGIVDEETFEKLFTD